MNDLLVKDCLSRDFKDTYTEFKKIGDIRRTYPFNRILIKYKNAYLVIKDDYAYRKGPDGLPNNITDERLVELVLKWYTSKTKLGNGAYIDKDIREMKKPKKKRENIYSNPYIWD